MNTEDLKKIIMDSCDKIDGKIKLSCAKAFELSDKHNIGLPEIAGVCNRNGIRIHKCQLGCFK